MEKRTAGIPLIRVSSRAVSETRDLVTAPVTSNAPRQLTAETNADPLTLSPNCTTVMETSKRTG